MTPAIPVRVVWMFRGGHARLDCILPAVPTPGSYVVCPGTGSYGLKVHSVIVAPDLVTLQIRELEAGISQSGRDRLRLDGWQFEQDRHPREVTAQAHLVSATFSYQVEAGGTLRPVLETCAVTQCVCGKPIEGQAVLRASDDGAQMHCCGRVLTCGLNRQGHPAVFEIG